MDLPARLILLAIFACIAVTAPLRSAEDPLTDEPLSVTPQVVLHASDGTPWDLFGLSVAMSGETAVVGSPTQDTPGGSDAGTAYVFVRTGSGWQEQAKLRPAGAGTGALYGNSVAISGDTILVGGSQSVCVFVRNGSAWFEQARLVPSNGVPAMPEVAVSGDTAVVGMQEIDSYTGEVAVFRRSGSAWSEEARLAASDGDPYDFFGRSLAISGDTLLVGAPDGSAAYVFVRNGSAWSQQARLSPALINGFGTSVAISGERIAVGTPSLPGVITFVRSGSAWSEEARVTSSSVTNLGLSVALSGDMLVTGGPYAPPRGLARFFVYRGSAWFEQTVLLPADSEQGFAFGRSIALSGSLALVGEFSGWETPGAAYLFPLDGVAVDPTGGLFTTEHEGTAFFKAALNTLPAGDVVIDLAPSDPEEATVSPDRLTFTPDDWWAAQTVTLTGVDDLIDDEGQPYTVTLTMNAALTEDAVYDGIDPPDVAAVNLPFEGDFYTVEPCRVLDTRLPGQEPPLTSGVVRSFAFHDVCGVPETARAIALNVTIVDPTYPGHLTLYPGGLPAPNFQTFPFAAQRNRAHQTFALLDIGGTGTLTVSPFLESGGAAHLVLDVSGYFE